MPRVLIIGANRGLGASLTKLYAERGWEAHGTTRSEKGPEGFPDSVKWTSKIDLMKPDVGAVLAGGLTASGPVDLLVSILRYTPNSTSAA